MKDRFGYVMVPKIAVAERRKLRFMYREEPDNTADSGWRLFSGDEDQEYVNNPRNIGIYDVNTIIAIDPDIEEFLDSEVRTAYERTDRTKRFELSKDFDVEQN